MRILKGGVAFFDSGIGGLTVLNECRKYLPNEIFYYYGDNKHAPYGNLSPKIIKRYVEKAFKVFKKLQVKAVVLACNTVTAVCVEELRKKFNFPILGVEPAVVSAAKQGGEVYVLTTRATYNSERFSVLCQKVALCYPNANITLKPCDRLAGEIERHILETNFNVEKWLPVGAPSAVVLGCTHYIYVKERVQRFYDCPCYDGNEGVARRLKSVLGVKKSEKRIKIDKNWAERPLLKKNRQKKERVTTCNPFKIKETKTNKCSWLKHNEYGQKSGRICFLGSGKRVNKTVYERMFVVDFKKSGQNSQKNQKNLKIFPKNP